MRGEVRAALSLSIPQPRVPEGEAQSEMIESILETASAISQQMLESVKSSDSREFVSPSR